MVIIVGSQQEVIAGADDQLRENFVEEYDGNQGFENRSEKGNRLHMF